VAASGVAASGVAASGVAASPDRQSAAVSVDLPEIALKTAQISHL
jgi:hypothetical protein